MSCYDNRYVGLRPAGALTQEHINALRTFGTTTPPVFRGQCPPGYTHCAGAFDASKPGQVANQNLWFVDEHGHVCMPKCGWGTQPELRIKDRFAQMVRSKEIDKDTVTPDKVRQAVSTMLCDPCTPGKSSVSRASCGITTTLRELEETDKLVQDKKLEGGALLSGGAKLSPRTKCDLEAMVRGLDATKRGELKAECEQITKDYKEKVAKKHVAMLQCKARKYEDDVPKGKFLDNASDNVKQALECAEYNGLNGVPKDCLRTSCFSGRAQVEDVVVVKQLSKGVKILKRQYHALVDVYSKLRRKTRGCCPLSLHDKMKLQCKVQHIFASFTVAVHRMQEHVKLSGKAPDLDTARTEADEMWEQMFECAALCAKDSTGCTTDSTNCVPSRYCESGMCVPAKLEAMRKQIKGMEKMKPAGREYVNYMDKVVSQHRRLSLV